MNILSIDDEELARKETSRQLRELLPQARIHEASDTSEARRILLDQKIDCVMLDLEMPGENGMELLPSLHSMGIPVIIVSGHEEYAVRSYDFAVVDYLLKPVELPRLAIALTRARKNHEGNSGSKVILLNDHKQCWPVKVEDVVLVEANGSCVTVLVSNGDTITLSRQLKEIEVLLDDALFTRANRSQIVNVANLSCMRKLGNGKLAGEIDGRKHIVFSRRQSAAFRAQHGF